MACSSLSLQSSATMKELLRSMAVRRLGLGGVREHSAARSKELKLTGIRHAIAVASAKGGVGKSTTAVNLAVALANECQMKVGLLDADIYGPNVPIMMKLDKKPDVTKEQKIIPIENYGVKCMSIGLLVQKDAPLVWRGPMVSSALEKLTHGVEWGTLDILVVDMPPGTGDTQITFSQRMQLSGAIIVSTPQDVALMDARRGINMFSKVQVPILGVIENMSWFQCPHCSEPSFIFGKGGTRKMADEMGLKFLGEIPLEPRIREGCDEGVPSVISAPDSLVSKSYSDFAHKVVERLEEMSKEPSLPEIHI